jgi:signal transduction histidine kinase
VAFAFALGIARQRAPGERDAAALESAQHEVRAALGELREVAHGLYPVALTDAGLAAAVESLSDRRPGLSVRSMPTERFTPAIEETAYFAVATLADQWSPEPVTVNAVADDRRLVIALSTTAAAPHDLIGLEDRVGALGGTVAIDEEPRGRTRIEVELPCG